MGDTEFEEVHGGTLVGNKDLEKKGVYILKNRVQGNNKSCWVYNTSKTPIMLKRQAIIAQVNEPDKKVVAVWSVKGNTEVPSVAQQRITLPSEATEVPSVAQRRITLPSEAIEMPSAAPLRKQRKDKKPSDAEQNKQKRGKS